MAYAHYVQTVLRRAWRQAWNMVVDKSLPALIRDALFVVVIFGSLTFLAGPLRSAGLIGPTANPAIDFGIITVATLCVIGGLFAAYFVVEAVFITPYRLWREQKEGAGSSLAVFTPSARLRYDVWDRVDPLPLYQAAALWVEIEPPSNSEELSGTIGVMVGVLLSAVATGKLKVLPKPPLRGNMEALHEMAVATLESINGMARGSMPRNPPDKMSQVTRKSLIAYAKLAKEKPKFLFSAER